MQVSLAPKLIILILAVGALIADFTLPSKRKIYIAYTSLLGLIVAGALTISLFGIDKVIFYRMIRIDTLSLLIDLLLIIFTIFIVLSSISSFSLHPYQGEYYSLILFSVLGAMTMAASVDLLPLYLGLELTVLPSFALVGLKKEARSSEAAIKYLLLGLFASAFMVYGISLIFGITGSTHFGEIANKLQQVKSYHPYLLLSILFLVMGFGFKVAVFPFHFWVPDAYETSFAQIGAFLSAVPKAAGFAAMLRFFPLALSLFKADWTAIFALLALASMTFGNLVAYAQKNIKRMLAYSSIAHAGYILVGLAVATKLSLSSMLLYILVYAFANLGAFSVVAAYSEQGENIEDFAGLNQKSPVLAFTMTIFLFSLVGIPPLAGFMGKIYLFGAAVNAGAAWLAVVGFLNSVLSLGYYSSVVKQMYLRTSPQDDPFSISATLLLSILLLAIAVLAVGIYPSIFLNIIMKIV